MPPLWFMYFVGSVFLAWAFFRMVYALQAPTTTPTHLQRLLNEEFPAHKELFTYIQCWQLSQQLSKMKNNHNIEDFRFNVEVLRKLFVAETQKKRLDLNIGNDEWWERWADCFYIAYKKPPPI